MTVTRAALLRAALAFISSQLMYAQTDASVSRSQHYVAVKVAAPPRFEPSLSDPAWHSAVTATGFENLTTRKQAALGTVAYLLYDNNNLYVGFRVKQDGVAIQASQKTNNVNFGQDDCVGIGLDTSGVGSEVYYFEATPAGVRYQQASQSTRYGPPWEAKTAINGSSWSAMFVIPLKNLRAMGGERRTWRFNFMRIVSRLGEHYTWAYDGTMTDGQPPNYPAFSDARFWPTLVGVSLPVDAARPKPRAEMYGLSSIGLERNVFQQANNSFAKQAVRNYGIDFVLPFSGTMALVGTLNPDFSNVEVDQQTIAPQEFQRSLAEYRPFFAQGAAFLNPNTHLTAGSQVNVPNQVFYSPSIGTFYNGFKVEGTYGDQTFGALHLRGRTSDDQALDDEAFGFQHAMSDRSFQYWVDGALARHAGVGVDSTIETGVLSHNLGSGFIWAFNQALEQSTFNANQRQQTFAYSRIIGVDSMKPNYESFAGYSDISPDYGPINGFTNYNDARGLVIFTSLTGSTPGLKSWNGYLGWDRFLTRRGAVHASDFLGTTDFTTKALVHVTLQQQTSSLDDRILTNGVSMPFHTSTITLGYRDGTASPLDISYSAGPFSTFYLQQFNVSVISPLGHHFNVQAIYAGTHERSSLIRVDGQILRSLALGVSLGFDTSASMAVRSINGKGGFAVPGLNWAAGLHTKFGNGSELYLNYGSPNSPATLNRFIAKYVWRIGGGAGT